MVPLTDVQARIKLALDRIRPAMQMDGADIQLVEWREADGVLRVQLTGSCGTGCEQGSTTMAMGVERVMRQLVPEVRFVETL